MNHNDVTGWLNYRDVYTEAVNRTEKGIFAEVGVYFGQSSIFLAERIKDSGKQISIVSIDLFPSKVELELEKSVGAGQAAEYNGVMSCPDSIIDKFVDNTRQCGVKDYIIPIKAESIKAASIFPDNYFDMVFLDDCHFKDYVSKELAVWWPKVKNGGMFCGHDYYSGVQEAVDEFFDGLGIKPKRMTDCWVVYK